MKNKNSLERDTLFYPSLSAVPGKPPPDTLFTHSPVPVSQSNAFTDFIQLKTLTMLHFLNLLPGKLRTSAALSLFCLSTLLAGNAYATDWYVALPPAGNNGNSGSANSPFATIQQAHDVAVSGDVIKVRPGTYRQQVNITKSGLRFEPTDGPGTVTIDGTDAMNGTWTSVGNSTYRTTMNWELYSPLDITEDPDSTHKGFGENQVFQDTTMIELLRWPKASNAVSKDVVKPTAFGGNAIGGFARAEGASRNEAARTITIRDDQFDGNQLWVGAKVFINLAHHGYDGQGWIGKVLAVSPGFITVNFWHRDEPGSGVGDTVWALGEDTEYYLFDPINLTEANISSLLGLGEWYKTGNFLYVKTRNGQQPTNAGANAIYSKRRYFAFAGDAVASNYTIEGFNLFACSVTTSTAAETNTQAATSTCSGVTFRNLTARYVSHQLPYAKADWQMGQAGWTGIVLNGKNHRVEGCTITYSASSAISIQGDGIKALNNKIYDSNYMFSNCGAINTGRKFYSYDQEIGGNYISNTAVTAISFRGIRNRDENVRGVARIHHNTIVNFMRRSGDSGAIDVFGVDLQWTRIDHNYIYNTLGHDLGQGGTGIHGIYLDFGDQSQTPNNNRIRAIVDHNVVTNTQTPMLQNGGWETEIFNNVFIGNGALQPDGTPYENAKWSIGNYAEAAVPNNGRLTNIFNNILSHPPSIDIAIYNIGNTFKNAVITNNITNATMAYLAQNPLLVAPKFGQETNRSINDFKLQDSQFAKAYAVDKGRGDKYSAARVPDIDPTVGLPDLGAFEWGSTGAADTEGPTTPGAFSVTDVTQRSFKLTWGSSTDLGGGAVSYYYLSSVTGSANPVSPRQIENGQALTAIFEDLAPSTTYSLQVVAYDNSGNPSLARTVTVTTSPKTPDVLIPKNNTASAIVLDGIKDAAYTLQPQQLNKLANGTPYTASADLGASWTATWDDANLYIHVAVTDDIRKIESPMGEWYADDNVEFFLNGNGNRPKEWNNTAATTDFQFFVRPGVDTVGLYSRQSFRSVRAPAGVATKTLNVGAASYSIELKVPFSVLGYNTPPADLTFLGIEVNVGDDDGETSSPKIVWLKEAYQSPYNFGLAQLTTSTVVPVNGVVVNPATATMTVGGASQQLTASVSPSAASQAVSWSSSNTGVATVSTSGVVTAVAAGTATITARSNVDNTKSAVATITVTAPITLREADTPASTLAGLDYKYYEGNWGNLPNFDALTPSKQGNVDNFNIVTNRNRSDNYGFKFTGYVYVPADGTYTFYTNSDDGCKLFIGNTQVVNNDFLQDGSVERSGTIGLKAGKHAITVTFFEASGGELLTVKYSGPNLTKQTIPASALSRSITGNFGFENDFTSWSTYGTASINTANVRSGAKSGYFANGGANYVLTGLTPNTTYKVRAWVKAVTGTDIWVVVSGFGGSGNNPGQKMTATSWTQSGDIVFTTGVGNTSVTLSAWTGNASAAYFDDYTIEPYCSTCRTASVEAESSLQTESLTLQLHPNPAITEVTVDLSGFEGEMAVQVKMSDMTGKLFVGQQVQMGEGVKQVTLPVSQMPQGLFFVTVQGSKVAKTAKLVITR
jgi:hypothetical protein